MPTDTLKFLPLTHENIDEVLYITSEAMDVDEPLNYCAGITPPEFLKFLQGHKELLLCEKMKDINCCAIDTKTNQIVGGFLFIDLFDQRSLPDSLWSNPKFEPIGEAMETIHQGYDESALEPNQVVKVLIRAVLPAYRRRGLASKAMDIAIKLSSERGFISMISETSSLYTRKAFLHRKGTSRNHINYCDFKDSQGNVPFAQAPAPHDGLHLMVIEYCDLSC